MADIRETVIARLVEVAGTVTGVVKVYRNQDEIPETSRPAIAIYDGDENADESANDRGRPSHSPVRVAMVPQVFIMLGGQPESVGTDLNTLCARLVKAVLTDTTLKSAVGTTGGIHYGGCASGLGRGRKVEGEMALVFTFTYVLKPESL